MTDEPTSPKIAKASNSLETDYIENPETLFPSRFTFWQKLVLMTMPFTVVLIVLAAYVISSRIADPAVTLIIGKSIFESVDQTRVVEYHMGLTATRQVTGIVVIYLIVHNNFATVDWSDNRQLIQTGNKLKKHSQFSLEFIGVWSYLSVVGLVYWEYLDALVQSFVNRVNPVDTGATPYDIISTPFSEEVIASQPGIVYYALRLSTFVIFAPLFEEYLFRKILIAGMKQRKFSDGSAILFSSILFGFFHTSNDIVDGSLSFTIRHFYFTFLTGIGLGYLYVWTKDIRYPILIHALINLNGQIFSVYFLEPLRDATLWINQLREYIGIVVVVILVVWAVIASFTKVRFPSRIAVLIPHMNNNRAFYGWLGSFLVIFFIVIFPVFWSKVLSNPLIPLWVILTIVLLVFSGIAFAVYLMVAYKELVNKMFNLKV